MTSRYVSLSRAAALSVAFSLFVSPIALAQTPVSATSTNDATQRQLISADAFARLVQGTREKDDRVPLVTNKPRVDLLGQVLAAPMRETPSASARKSVSPPRSWAGRHKLVTGILITVGAIFGLLLDCWIRCED